MKTLIFLFSLSGLSFAEKSSDQVNHSFFQAAAEYQAKAKIAQQNGNAHNAVIYKRLAAIKREAAKTQGHYDWTEYHSLVGKLKQPKYQTQPKKKHLHSFDKAAKRYDQLAQQAARKGLHDTATTYRRMAAIKREAAVSNGAYDWSEYHQLEASLHDKKTAPPLLKASSAQREEDFISMAQHYTVLANQYQNQGDTYASEISIQLAALFINAAAEKAQDKKPDFSKHTHLQSMLKKHLAK